MTWAYFGELRSALAAQDWQQVAVWMDGRGGCDDERARQYAYDLLCELPEDQRPFRIAVGSNGVGRGSLLKPSSVDIASAMVRKRVYGGSFVLAPLYGFTPQAIRRRAWDGWNTTPHPLRTPLGAARLDVLLTAYRGDWTPTGLDGQRAHTGLIGAAIKALCEMKAIGDDNHSAEGAILRELLKMGHPRISEGFTRGDVKRLLIDGDGSDWAHGWQAALTEIMVSSVGNEITSALRFRAAGLWYAGRPHEDDVRVLVERGRLRAHILRAAGVWLAPSPHVDGEPVRIETGKQESLLRIAKEASGHVAPRQTASLKATAQAIDGQTSLFGEGGAA